jgi:hypothetical protein
LPGARDREITGRADVDFDWWTSGGAATEGTVKVHIRVGLVSCRDLSGVSRGQTRRRIDRGHMLIAGDPTHAGAEHSRRDRSSSCRIIGGEGAVIRNHWPRRYAWISRAFRFAIRSKHETFTRSGRTARIGLMRKLVILLALTMMAAVPSNPQRLTSTSAQPVIWRSLAPPNRLVQAMPLCSTSVAAVLLRGCAD